jgi:hypothetical protein
VAGIEAEDEAWKLSVYFAIWPLTGIERTGALLDFLRHGVSRWCCRWEVVDEARQVEFGGGLGCRRCVPRPLAPLALNRVVLHHQLEAYQYLSNQCLLTVEISDIRYIVFSC